MDRAHFHSHMESTFAACLALSKRKNADYAGATDPFANFRQVSNLNLCSVATGILVRLSDKFTRISNLLSGADGPRRDPAVTDESVVDTIRDAINYLAILGAWLDEERGTPTNEQKTAVFGVALTQKEFDKISKQGESVRCIIPEGAGRTIIDQHAH